ncbi:MAG: hypothetical protein LDL31_04960 [Prosthecobacter sp.]|jgi:hypothetical protein|nr:hypothetical protein [Prosthecobacter sp.]
MSLPRLFPLLACAFSISLLSSCQFGEQADAVNPTVAEMDALDVRWGLPPRKSKGGPRRVFQYIDNGPRSASAAPAASAPTPAAPPARETVNSPPPQQAAPASVPANLR